MDINKVKKAHTSKVKDAVTKGVLQAVMQGSHNASYREIDIHKVKTADALYARPGTASSINALCSKVQDSTITVHSVDIGCVHTDRPGYKNADNNLTIEELFRNAGRNFR